MRFRESAGKDHANEREEEDKDTELSPKGGRTKLARLHPNGGSGPLPSDSRGKKRAQSLELHPTSYSTP